MGNVPIVGPFSTIYYRIFAFILTCVPSLAPWYKVSTLMLSYGCFAPLILSRKVARHPMFIVDIYVLAAFRVIMTVVASQAGGAYSYRASDLSPPFLVSMNAYLTYDTITLLNFFS